jgi:hypothetical protein
MMRFVNWFVNTLGVLARGFDVANWTGPGIRGDEARRRADQDDAYRRRQDYRP